MARIALAVLVAVGIAVAMSRAFPARAQDRELLLRQQWIHDNAKDCCPHDRCFPVTARPSVHFWDVLGFKSFLRIGEERRWPFQETFGCAYAGSPDTIRCLFRPPPEAS